MTVGFSFSPRSSKICQLTFQSQHTFTPHCVRVKQNDTNPITQFCLCSVLSCHNQDLYLFKQVVSRYSLIKPMHWDQTKFSNKWEIYKKHLLGCFILKLEFLPLQIAS